MTVLQTVLMTCLACFACVALELSLSLYAFAVHCMDKNPSGHARPFSGGSNVARACAHGRLLPLPEDIPGTGAFPVPGHKMQTSVLRGESHGVSCA